LPIRKNFPKFVFKLSNGTKKYIFARVPSINTRFQIIQHIFVLIVTKQSGAGAGAGARTRSAAGARANSTWYLGNDIIRIDDE